MQCHFQASYQLRRFQFSRRACPLRKKEDPQSFLLGLNKIKGEWFLGRRR